ncbi:MAG: alpha/beta hydrolase [bacterium]|nr:alpha/beta hydrolase [bacterium]
MGLRKSLALLGALAAVLCAALARSPGQGKVIWKVQRDIAYGSHPLQKLDLYRPEASGLSFRKKPVVVFAHSGGWATGSKEDIELSLHLELLIEARFQVVSVNYRLSPEVLYPEPESDVARAIQFLRANADEYRFDPDRILAWGISSGGVMMAALAFGADFQDLSSSDPVDRESSRPNVAYVVNASTCLTGMAYFPETAAHFGALDPQEWALVPIEDKIAASGAHLVLDPTVQLIPTYHEYIGSREDFPTGDPHNPEHGLTFFANQVSRGDTLSQLYYVEHPPNPTPPREVTASVFMNWLEGIMAQL